MSYELVSYNRPLTRSAHRALKDYGIIEENSVNEFGRWTVVEVQELPPKELRETHELRWEREPQHVITTPNGEEVVIFEDEVRVDGRTVTMSPEDALKHAKSEGWIDATEEGD